MREVRIPAFAKINLRLDILGKRADGYHELRTIFQTISLHDELRLRASRQARNLAHDSRQRPPLAGTRRRKISFTAPSMRFAAN